MAEYIEREALLADIDAAMENEGMGYVVGQTMKRYVKRVTAADGALVRHGRWVYDHWCEFRCSVCGEFSNSDPYRGKENYCPNCGADMRGINDE